MRDELITLNGKVGKVATDDDNDYTLGVLDVTELVTFDGKKIVDKGQGFPLTKEMAERIGWGNYKATLRFTTSPSPIDPAEIEENLIKSYYGLIEAEYYHQYSEVTGYLWTDETFKIGGHDICEILESYEGQYIHLEIIIHRPN
jgi:hypothetical protein